MGVVAKNPIIDYCKSIILPAQGQISVLVDGEKKVYDTNEALEADFTSEKIHPKDLKTAVAEAINDLLQPVRDHFETDPYAKKLLA